jgi:hypothetical protein
MLDVTRLPSIVMLLTTHIIWHRHAVGVLHSDTGEAVMVEEYWRSSSCITPGVTVTLCDKGGVCSYAWHN